MNLWSKIFEKKVVEDVSLSLLLTFLIVGILNTCFSYFIYCIFLFIGLNYAFASFIALVAGIFWSFFTTGHVVFAAKLKGRFLKFVMVWILLYLVNISIITIFIKFGITAYLAGFLAIIPTSILSFILQKTFVFIK